MQLTTATLPQRNNASSSSIQLQQNSSKTQTTIPLFIYSTQIFVLFNRSLSVINRRLGMKKTDNYAANQIRILLHELKNPVHKIKVKAIEAFKNYIETYQPDVSLSSIERDADDDDTTDTIHLEYISCISIILRTIMLNHAIASVKSHYSSYVTFHLTYFSCLH